MLNLLTGARKSEAKLCSALTNSKLQLTEDGELFENRER